MNYSGGYADGTVAAGLDKPVQCVSVTAGDFDNDMDVDLYFACRTGASNLPNIVYENLGNGTFREVANAAGAVGPVGVAVASGAGTADSAIAGDYDVDGFLDLFVTNGFNLRPLEFGGPNSLFHNLGNANHWIELDLASTASDHDAVGARVYATANGVTQMRVQNGGLPPLVAGCEARSLRSRGRDLCRPARGMAERHRADVHQPGCQPAVSARGRRRHAAVALGVRRRTMRTADHQPRRGQRRLRLAGLSVGRVAPEDGGGWRQRQLSRHDHLRRA